MLAKVVFCGLRVKRDPERPPKWGFFKFYVELKDIFLIFCMDLLQQKWLKFLGFFWEKSCFVFFCVKRILISRELIFFRCFDFVELFIKITPSIIKSDSGAKFFFGKAFVLQSISRLRLFSSSLNGKPFSYLKPWVQCHFSLVFYYFDVRFRVSLFISALFCFSFFVCLCFCELNHGVSI